LKEDVMTAIQTGPSISSAVDARHLVWAQRALALARICLGFVFLWAFLDKNFGLGRPTPSGQGWSFGSGPDPTTAYLQAVQGPFAGMFHAMAGQTWVTWLYMVGLLGIGIGLMTGMAFRLSAICGVAMLAFLYAASLPVGANPFVDDHVIEAFMLVGLILIRNGHTWGLGAWWDSVVGTRIPLLR
jgi:thiosulfate dehydrogenase [quinone] large subunit